MTRVILASSWSVYPGRISAFTTRLTLELCALTTSQARLMTAIHSSHSPSRVVNIASVRYGKPDLRTTSIASATAGPTEPSGSDDTVGATENAKSILLRYSVSIQRSQLTDRRGISGGSAGISRGSAGISRGSRVRGEDKSRAARPAPVQGLVSPRLGERPGRKSTS